MEQFLFAKKELQLKRATPKITSQMQICPIPFHFDPYIGCKFNCLYCFARDLVEHNRRVASKIRINHGKSPENPRKLKFNYLIARDPDYLERWIKRTLKKDPKTTKNAAEIAFQNRLPVKIGANSDPFPPLEQSYKITLKILKILHAIDYPVEIQTKNPMGIIQLLQSWKIHNLSDLNWTIAISQITTDDVFRKVCEPMAPSIANRFNAITKLTKLGLPVMIKCQPFILPITRKELNNLIKRTYESGCWAFQSEGLKYRKTMNAADRNRMQLIGDFLQKKYTNDDAILKKFHFFDMRKAFSVDHDVEGLDWLYPKEWRYEFHEKAISIAHKFNLKYFCADNDMGALGDGYECCGTEKLRNYRIWGKNSRTLAFCNNLTPQNHIKELENVKIKKR